ncbi:HPr family phosphocarrier protein [Pseudoflavonifractor sp. 60]|uniref:HPr family phosphocarrier protein n=1 Tax=Pseudoflavonifractor sp. 60 TaxID=2304576 RepID=UPI00136C8EC7|nr:HPr family phosphocarrier protein [Pseudoflavonifractor sp. 60]NBI66392.1 HPr family phosphocarrier protein [Pseudoflavonifractor sp. 60]
MTSFEYTITAPVGIHTRYAGLVARTAKALDSTITIGRVGGVSTLATKILAVMGLNLKQGDTVSVTVEGGNEDTNAGTMEWLFKNNL